MTAVLPCPFCGHVGLSHGEGSSFRWLSTECNGCGAQCGEERIDTLTMERGAAIEQAKVAAIKTWNTRSTPLPPPPQAAPLTKHQQLAIVESAINGHASTRNAVWWAVEYVERYYGIKEPKP